MKVYKLTDANMRNHGGTQWEIGKPKRTSGKGDLCGTGWLHWYEDPLLAVLHNPIHANLVSPRLFEARADGKIKRNGWMKAGATGLTLIKEIPLPVVSIRARVYYAIICARAVIGDRCPAWSKWAEAYLSGNNEEASAAWSAAAAAALAEAWSARCKNHLDLSKLAHKAIKLASKRAMGGGGR